MRAEFLPDYDIAKSTWFGVGGKLDMLFRPTNIQSLQDFLKQNKDDLTILGNCSNVIIRDGGIGGITIKLGKSFASMVALNETDIEVGCAALDVTLASFACQNNISGLEFLCTIPGSIGGAIAMNAGCFGGEISDILVSCKAIDYNGNIHEFLRSDIEFSYRKNMLKEMIFTSCVLRGRAASLESILATMNDIKAKREAAQPQKVKTGGSTFKNPKSVSAWELVRKSGLSGYNIGGAMVSEKHSNFLINTGNATASDIESLGEFVKSKVLNDSNVELEWEIARLGRKIL